VWSQTEDAQLVGIVFRSVVIEHVPCNAEQQSTPTCHDEANMVVGQPKMCHVMPVPMWKVQMEHVGFDYT